MHEPCAANDFQAPHAALLLSSFHRLTGRRLLEVDRDSSSMARLLFDAPFGLVSHDTRDDPVFNYGNSKALRLFEMDWNAFTALPSRRSAEPVNQAERARLLQRVSSDGYIDDYTGIRISATGQRFLIENATVWNLLDERGVRRGQAAVFHQWTIL